MTTSPVVTHKLATHRNLHLRPDPNQIPLCVCVCAFVCVCVCVCEADLSVLQAGKLAPCLLLVRAAAPPVSSSLQSSAIASPLVPDTLPPPCSPQLSAPRPGHYIELMDVCGASTPAQAHSTSSI